MGVEARLAYRQIPRHHTRSALTVGVLLFILRRRWGDVGARAEVATLARALATLLQEAGYPVEQLDGDVVDVGPLHMGLVSNHGGHGE